MKRGYGGVAIVWKKEINENIKELIDGGNRIQAIHIQQRYKPICLINVYMPSDNKNADIKYKDTLAQIDEMIEKYNDTHEIIVCGDTNGSLYRSSTLNDKILQTFCKEKCIGNTEKCPINETFYHQNGKSKGQIDNTSDHVAVILTLNCQLKKIREKATIIAKPKWADCDHQIYKDIINKDQPNLMQKSKGIIEQDIRNLEKLLHKAGEAAIPKYRRKVKIKSKGKAIWNEQIEKASKQ
ncbi:E3.1.11.2 [Mytilus coruscus]|uniref:E3.1.11.2 n=1 Tax=Mytilus coruscus TaxID=42192 RepID=A0A6J8ADX0_MYTCO|nr:E3.1.11.2 [Mytilus coruscus]